MLQLRKITITQFRNYTLTAFGFTERVVGICGLNGRGKTNLLDAIYYCCFTKSYFTATDAGAIQFGLDGFRLESDFEKQDEAQRVTCIHRVAGKKELLLNDVPYEKFSKHIGQFPVVMVAPDDIELITGGSELRRRFMDTVLSQMHPEYLQQLIQYNKILQQRNSLLKRFAELGHTDLSLLDVLDEQLLKPGKLIYDFRKTFCEQLVPLVHRFYGQIANNGETVLLQYESKLHECSFEGLLQQYRERDLLSQRSNAGIHKDELGIQLNGQPFRTTASQGQRKSLLFALKLSEFELLKSSKGFAPLLLLDDVFEKLDDNRMRQLLHWVCNENQGQVFITDTHRDRLEAAFGGIGTRFQIIEL